jgi:hypothetical protein
MQAVDDLNLKHGIIHQDIAHRNLLINSASDSIVLIDFNEAYRVGVEKNGTNDHEGRWRERDDVKGVLVFLYEYITRDPALDEHYVLHMLNEKDFIDPAKWIKHPDVELDEEVAEFYFELMAWVRGRRRARHQMKHYTKAPQPLEWPQLHTKKGGETDVQGRGPSRRWASVPGVETPGSIRGGSGPPPACYRQVCRRRGHGRSSDRTGRHRKAEGKSRAVGECPQGQCGHCHHGQRHRESQTNSCCWRWAPSATGQ